jgi:DNA-binding SARP family transcriptional activator/tetratricopeptide (TPR) repeat protein
VHEVAVLGELGVTRAGERLEITGGLPRRVLLALASRSGRPVTDEELVDWLWVDDPPASALQSVRNAVARLRRTMGADAVERGPRGYRLGEGWTTDAQRFDHLVAEARRHLDDGEPAEAVETLDRARSLVRGRPLDEVADEHWAVVASHELAERIAAADDLWCGAVCECGPAMAAVQLAAMHRSARAVPQREVRWLALMRANVAAGDRVGALRTYQEAVRALAEFGMAPGPELRAAEAEVLADDSISAAPGDHRWVTTARRHGVLPPPSPVPFVGRAEQLERLCASASQLDLGGPLLVVLTGPSGVGKTRLAMEAARASTLPARLATFDADLGAPLGGLRGALADVVAVLASSRALRGAEQPGAHRLALAERFRAELRASVGEGALLVVDDLQDADPLSLVLLRHALLDPDPYPLLVVAALRTDAPLPPAVATLRERAGRLGRLVEIPVVGLDAEGIAQLITSVAPGAAGLADEVLERSGGNPYVAIRLLQSLPADPTTADLAEPDLVVDATEARLGLLDPDGRALLEMTALVGIEAELRVLEQAAGITPAEIDRLLAPAITVGLAQRAGRGPTERVRLDHALLRAHLVEVVAPLVRRQLHASLADAMEHAADLVAERPGAVAAQWLAAGPAHAQRALAHLVAASRLAMEQLAFEDAAAFAADALALAGDDPALQAELLVRRGEALVAAGSLADAVHAFSEALEPARRAGDRARLVAATVGATGAYVANAQDAEARALVESVLAEVTDPAQRVVLLGRSVLLAHGQGEESRRRALEAVALADQVGTKEARLRALDALVHTLHGPGTASQRLSVSEGMLDLAVACGEHTAYRASAIRGVVAAVELGLDERASELVEAMAHPPWGQLDPLDHWWLLSERAMLATVAGDLDAAEDLAVEGRDLGRRIGVDDASAWYFMQLFSIRRAGGRSGELADVFARGASASVHLSWRAAAVIELAAAGRREEAASVMEGVAAEIEALPYDYLWFGTLTLAHEAACRVGHPVAEVIAGALAPMTGLRAVYGSGCAYVGPPGLPV